MSSLRSSVSWRHANSHVLRERNDTKLSLHSYNNQIREYSDKQCSLCAQILTGACTNTALITKYIRKIKVIFVLYSSFCILYCSRASRLSLSKIKDTHTPITAQHCSFLIAYQYNWPSHGSSIKHKQTLLLIYEHTSLWILNKDVMLDRIT